MADWEIFAGLLFGIAALVAWTRWYGDVARVNRFTTPGSYRLVLSLVPVACLLLLLLVLLAFAARAVRENGLYVALYLVMGAATLGIATLLFPFLGISARDDVLERRNNAALIAVTGAVLGAALCFIGGNVGEGPGPKAVVVSAGVATSAWFALWILLEVLSGSRFAERITVERDRSGGLRLAGLLVADGIIVGAAAAGDWVPGRFFHDFTIAAWPALVMTVGAAVLERALRVRASVVRSAFIVSAYVVLALLWAFHWSIRA